MKISQGLFPVAQIANGGGEVVGDEILIALTRSPNLVDGLSKGLPQLRAHRKRIGPIVGKCEIELQRFRGERLDSGVLAGVDAVGSPNQEAHGQGQQQDEEPDDRSDHVARTPGCGMLRQHPLQEEADHPAEEDGETNTDRKFLRTHSAFPN
jgi:hypothetical protein